MDGWLVSLKLILVWLEKGQLKYVESEVKVKVKLLSHVRLCDPMDYSLSGSLRGRLIHRVGYLCFCYQVLDFFSLSGERNSSMMFLKFKNE